MGILGSITSFAAKFFFPVGEYNSNPAADPLTDGQQGPLQLTALGSLRVRDEPGSAISTPAQVTATGSAVALSAAACRRLLLQADSGNTTKIRFGDSGISTTRGLQLAPGDSAEIEIDNANKIYIIAESGSPKLNLGIIS